MTQTKLRYCSITRHYSLPSSLEYVEIQCSDGLYVLHYLTFQILDVNHAWDAQYRKLQAETQKEINDLRQQIDILKDSEHGRHFDKVWSATKSKIDTERKTMEQEKKVRHSMAFHTPAGFVTGADFFSYFPRAWLSESKHLRKKELRCWPELNMDKTKSRPYSRDSTWCPSAKDNDKRYAHGTAAFMAVQLALTLSLRHHSPNLPKE